MTYELTIHRKNTINVEGYMEKFEADTLLELLFNFQIFLATRHRLDVEKLRADNDRLKYTLKHHNLDEDDIPF